MGVTLQDSGVKTGKKRETFLDLLRIVACFFVIINHTTGFLFRYRSPAETMWFLGVGYFYLSKPAVLVFFMISGYLLLGRQDNWYKTWQKIWRILVLLVICAAVYAVHHGLREEPRGTVQTMLEEFFRVYKMAPSNALWYMYAYLGVLVMLPFLQKMAAGMGKADYYVLFLVGAVYVGAMPILTHYKEHYYLFWEFKLPLISYTVLMLFAGQYFAKFGVKKTPLGFAAAAVLGVVMVLVSVAGTYGEFVRNGGKDYMFYDNRELLPNMIASVCIFYLATFLTFSPRTERIVTSVGSCTFGMYLIGDLVMDLLQPVRDAMLLAVHPLIAAVLYEILIFLTCLLVISQLRKITWVKKLIG